MSRQPSRLEAMLAERDEVLRRTVAIVNRLCPAVPRPVSSFAPYPTQESVKEWWAALLRHEAAKRERERLHKIIYPRIAAKARSRIERARP